MKNMKKVICAAVAMMAAVSLAEQATIVTAHPGAAPGFLSEYIPLKLTLAGPVALPWGTWDVYGLEVGVWNDTPVMKGLQVGVINVVDEFSGLQIGAVNVTDQFCGLQIGAVNVSRIGCGFQIGVVNVVSGMDHPFLPVINCAF